MKQTIRPEPFSHQNLHPGIYPSMGEYAPHFIPENVSELTYRAAFGKPVNLGQK